MTPTTPPSLTRSCLREWFLLPFSPGPGAQHRLSLLQKLAWPLVRGYAHLELPAFGHLLHRFGMNDQPAWAGWPMVRTRERATGDLIDLDLSDFFQRIAFFFGVYNELDVLSACEHALRPGDVFLDGGANIGLVALRAAWRIGPEGLVHCFECNPRILERLRTHVRLNEISNILVHPLGLGDAPATLPFRLPGAGNDAAGTFSPIPDRYNGQQTDLGFAQIVRGDDALDPADSRPLTIKLDVEGYELKALRGLEQTLRRLKPALVTEINNEMLAQCGTSVPEMWRYLSPLGYRPFAIDRAGFRARHRLWLHPVQGVELTWEPDLMWLATGSLHWQRLESTMQPRGKYWRHIDFAKAAAAAGRAG